MVSDRIIHDDADEAIPDEDVIYQITTFGADFTVDGLVKRFGRGDIFRPEFQRNFVWTVSQASKVVESILLGLPIPSVFLYREESTQKHLIVDGLQRLTTLHSFMTGRFRHNNKVFSLKDVKSRFEGKTIDDLEPEDHRRFEDAVIHAMIIQQTAPNDNNSSVFQIFDRLNSNGTPLQPQEMRAAVYHGEFQKLLGILNENAAWRDFFGAPHRRAKDQELILRFFALLNERKTYEKPMKKFLNDYMRDHRDISASAASSHTGVFSSTIQRVVKSLGVRAFRPKNALNVAVFDAVMVAVAERPHVTTPEISRAYEKLLKDADFIRMTSDSTSDVGNVIGRIDKALEFLDAPA